jgi:DNA-binding transcriptional ArsR family regulator
MSERRQQQISGARAPSHDEGPALSEETVESLAAILRVLGDPTRIRLIEALKDRDGATVGALSSSLPLTRQGVSRQLGVLHQAGLVRRRREGMWVHYELADWTGWWVVEQLAGAIAVGSGS